MGLAMRKKLFFKNKLPIWRRNITKIIPIGSGVIKTENGTSTYAYSPKADAHTLTYFFRNGKVNQKLFEKSDFSKNEYSTDSNESMKSYDSSISLQHVTPTMTNSSKPVPNHTQGHHNQVHQMHQVHSTNQMCPNRPGEVEICRTDIRLKRPRTIKPKEIDSQWYFTSFCWTLIDP